MKTRPCEGCGGEMPVQARAHARYCAPRCRARAARQTSIPAELRALPRWVRHTAAKVPLTIDGRAASATAPTTWAPYAAARSSAAGAGLGFVLNGDGIICLDLDHCLTPAGEPLRDVTGLLERLPATYTEVSPSGDGLHVWLRGELPRSGRLRMFGVRLEGYADQRYITVTGRRFGSTPSVLAQL